jgi:hypothetical protein
MKQALYAPHGRDIKHIQNFGRKFLRPFEDADVSERTMFKLIVRKQDGRVWNGII